MPRVDSPKRKLRANLEANSSLTKRNKCIFKSLLIVLIFFQLHIPRQPTSWIIYNILLTIWFNFWFILALFYWGWKPWYPRGTDARAKYFIFASDWAYMAACFYLIMRLIVIIAYQWRRGFKGRVH